MATNDIQAVLAAASPQVVTPESLAVQNISSSNYERVGGTTGIVATDKREDAEVARLIKLNTESGQRAANAELDAQVANAKLSAAIDDTQQINQLALETALQLDAKINNPADAAEDERNYAITRSLNDNLAIANAELEEANRIVADRQERLARWDTARKDKSNWYFPLLGLPTSAQLVDRSVKELNDARAARTQVTAHVAALNSNATATMAQASELRHKLRMQNAALLETGRELTRRGEVSKSTVENLRLQYGLSKDEVDAALAVGSAQGSSAALNMQAMQSRLTSAQAARANKAEDNRELQLQRWKSAILRTGELTGLQVDEVGALTIAQQIMSGNAQMWELANSTIGPSAMSTVVALVADLDSTTTAAMGSPGSWYVRNQNSQPADTESRELFDGINKVVDAWSGVIKANVPAETPTNQIAAVTAQETEKFLNNASPVEWGTMLAFGSTTPAITGVDVLTDLTERIEPQLAKRIADKLPEPLQLGKAAARQTGEGADTPKVAFDRNLNKFTSDALEVLVSDASAQIIGTVATDTKGRAKIAADMNSNIDGFVDSLSAILPDSIKNSSSRNVGKRLADSKGIDYAVPINLSLKSPGFGGKKTQFVYTPGDTQSTEQLKRALKAQAAEILRFRTPVSAAIFDKDNQK